jgi:hypothetical protein
MKSMPELVLLSLGRTEFMALHKAAAAGDPDAIDALGTLWSDHQDKEIECFTCGNTIEERPLFAMILPEYNDNSRLIAAPLCTTCKNRPPTLRWAPMSANAQENLSHQKQGQAGQLLAVPAEQSPAMMAAAVVMVTVVFLVVLAGLSGVLLSGMFGHPR